MKNRIRTTVYLKPLILEMVQEVMRTENRSQSNTIEMLIGTGAYVKLQMINDKHREAMNNE